MSRKGSDHSRRSQRPRRRSAAVPSPQSGGSSSTGCAPAFQLFAGETARNLAAQAIEKACRGEDARAYLDAVESPAKRALAKAQARAGFMLISYHARQAVRVHPDETARYIARRVPEGLRPLV